MIVVTLCTDYLHEKGLFPPVTYKPDEPENGPENNVDKKDEKDQENRLFRYILYTCIIPEEDGHRHAMIHNYIPS